jgi:hypothetical protein
VLSRNAATTAGAAQHETVALRGVKLSVATSVRAADWEAAMIYPHSRNPAYVLSDWQRQQLALFA